jgi:MFS transporter, Spinster family, sphingosine-1-phosphate transporter
MTSGDTRQRAARWALVVLTLINLFNYLDRFVISSLVEALKKSELHLSDTQLGSLATGFIIIYMVTAPVFGTLGDRKRRPPLIALGVAIWSIATALGGLAGSFGALFAARATVGVGEAAYGTIAPALLSDHYPVERRGRAFAVFFSAIPVGAAAGYILGGLVGQHYGWRAAFLIAGLPGLLLAALCLFLRDVPRGQHDEIRTDQARRKPLDAYLHLLRNRRYVLTVLGYAPYTFALGGLAFWTPAFLERVRGMTRAEATVTFGSIALGTGLVGTFAGGWLGDYLLPRTRQSYLWVSGLATLLAAPAAFVAFNHPNRAVYLTAMVVAELLIFASTGPVNSAIVNVVSPVERASAVALSIFAIHLFGDVPSPPLIGWISDRSSLSTAFLIVPVAILVAGAIWAYAAWDTERREESALS